MKKNIFGALALLALTVTLISAGQKDDEIMTKENGMYVVNTTTLGKDVQGYVSTTPVKVYIKKNKVEKVEFLKNQDTKIYGSRQESHAEQMGRTEGEGRRCTEGRRRDRSNILVGSHRQERTAGTGILSEAQINRKSQLWKRKI